MKAFEKIGKKFALVFIFLNGIIAKVYSEYYAVVGTQCAYGVYAPVRETTASQQSQHIVSTIIMTTIIPLIMLIGLIVFFIKSTGSVLKKIIVSIGVVLLYVLIRVLFKNAI